MTISRSFHTLQQGVFQLIKGGEMGLLAEVVEVSAPKALVMTKAQLPMNGFFDTQKSSKI